MSETAGTWGTKEAAAYIGCTPGTLRIWVWKQRVPHIKVGRLTRFLKADLDNFLSERRVEVKA
jgi:excisionase family DNA binding protein